MHEESALSAVARRNIRRLHRIVVTLSEELDRAFEADPPATDGSISILALQLANAGHRLREETQVIMEQETLRIRADRVQALDHALQSATAASP